MTTTQFNENADIVDGALSPTGGNMYSNIKPEVKSNIKTVYKNPTEPNTIDLSVLNVPTTKIEPTSSSKTNTLINNTIKGAETNSKNKQTIPQGWDATTYANFKAANPTLEPTPEDTTRMMNAGNKTDKQNNFDVANQNASAGEVSLRESMQGATGKGKALESGYAAAKINEKQAKIDEIDELVLNKTNALKQQGITDELDIKKLETQMAGVPISVVRGRQSLLEAQRTADRTMKAVEIESLSAISNLYQGKVDKAKENIKNSIDLEFADKEKAIENEKFFLSRTDDKRAEARKEMLDEETRKLDEQKAQKEKSFSYITNAVQSGAPNSLITKAQDVLNKGGNSVDVARMLGNYSISPADRIDMNLKQAQYNKLVNEVGKEEATKQQQIKAQIPILKDKLSLIDSIIGNPDAGIGANKAIDTTVGPNRMAREGMFVGIPGLVGFGSSAEAMLNKATGRTQQLIGAVNQLVSKEFLSSVLNLKAQGGTLGQLTEREGEKLQNAATQIGTWEMRDKKTGQITGYNIDEKSFAAELNKIKESTKAIYEASGGDANNLLSEEEYAKALTEGGSAYDNLD